MTATNIQLDYMTVVFRNGPIAIDDIAALMRRSHGTVAGMVKLLVGAGILQFGYVKTERGAPRKPVSLTDKGRATLLKNRPETNNDRPQV